MIEFISQFLTGILDSIHQFTGSYGWAIIVFSVLIKLVLYYPTQSQYKSMKEMQKIQPELQELQKKYKGTPEKMQAEQMALFKKHGVSPFGGCLPLIIQLPVLWGIFHAIRSLAEQGKFNTETFLWIGGSLSRLFPNQIAGSLAERDLPLIVLYGFSMYLSQKLTVTQTTAEGSQKMMSLVMPIAFTFILWNFPSALILYWLMFNVLSIIQQVIVMRQPDDKPSVRLTSPDSDAGSDSDSSDDDGDEEETETDIDGKQVRTRSRSRKKKGGK